MKTLRTVTSARTAQRNTPETDEMPEVPHLVTGHDASGPWVVRIMAEAPDTALDIVSTMPEEDFKLLPRVEDPDVTRLLAAGRAS